LKFPVKGTVAVPTFGATDALNDAGAPATVLDVVVEKLTVEGAAATVRLLPVASVLVAKFASPTYVALTV
jgi:hypothetical protein